jgi:nucleoside-diphosphate-sugar epimerase
MILITGASANVGSEVLKQAAIAGLPIRAAYQSRQNAQRAPAGVETVVIDYTSSETVGARCAECKQSSSSGHRFQASRTSRAVSFANARARICRMANDAATMTSTVLAHV